MTKGNRKYIIVLVLCFIGLMSIKLLAPKAINWNLSYSKKDKIPYGTAALYSVLPDLFPGQQITDVAMPAYNTLAADNYEHANYIIINYDFQIDTLDMHALFEFVKKGNHVFIAANYFGGKFADSLKIKTDNFFDLGDKAASDSAAFANMYKPKEKFEINFTNPVLKSKQNYVYTKCFENNYFTSFDTAKAIVLGTNETKKANYISIKMGKGAFYISTLPDAFCNYNFANETNNEYAVKAFSYLPLGSVIWDEHYKANNKTKETPLRVIFNNPPLTMAYYVLMISLLLFMIIGIKRTQRIIPVIEPLQNTTLQFVEVVGSLYYQTGDHKNIADKKIIYFLEYIRHAFQVKTNLYDDAFINRISDLSGIQREKIVTLFYYFSEFSARQKVTQEELIKLNQLIEEFYKLNKR